MTPDLRIGLSTPVVIGVPGATGEWERTAGIDDIASIAETADALGFDYLTCSEHVAVPADAADVRGATYWDPLATLSFLAARTSRIALTTSVLVLGYHHPLDIAKRYGTLDRMSGGRVVLGVGVGSIPEEFDLLGASWSDRGARADDALRALRAAWSTTRASYDGTYYRFRDMIVEPCAVRTDVPIWVGGRTRRSLRRAVDLGDGWMPFGLRGNEIADLLGSVDVPADFDVVLATRPLDPIGEPERVRHRLHSLREHGATAITCAFDAQSAGHYRDQMAALADLTDDIARHES